MLYDTTKHNIVIIQYIPGYRLTKPLTHQVIIFSLYNSLTVDNDKNSKNPACSKFSLLRWASHLIYIT